MAKTTAPLLSFDAAGQIGKSQVYAKWKGRSYVRRYLVPANPQSTEQTKTRSVFSWLQSVYKVAPSLVTDVWKLYARGKALTDRNAFSKFNVSILRTASDLETFTMSPGALGGLPPISQANTPGSGTISCAVTVPSVLPTGWTITSAITAVLRDQDPHSGLFYNISAAEDLTSPYTNAFSGLAAGDWEVFSWLKWARPDGSIAYSPSIQSDATVT